MRVIIIGTARVITVDSDDSDKIITGSELAIFDGIEDGATFSDYIRGDLNFIEGGIMSFKYKDEKL